MSAEGTPYREVPVAVARDIAEHCGKAQVIILAFDAAHGRTTVTTFGVSATDKQQAAAGGDRLGKYLSLDDGTVHEDWRLKPLAEYKELVDKLTAQRDKLLQVVRYVGGSLAQSWEQIPPIVARDCAEKCNAINRELNLL